MQRRRQIGELVEIGEVGKRAVAAGAPYIGTKTLLLPPIVTLRAGFLALSVNSAGMVDTSAIS